MLRRIVLSGWLVLLAASISAACNIPVFRYALERWHPDKTELIAFVDESLTKEDKSFLKKLEDAAATSDGSANIELTRATPTKPGEHAEVWKSASAEDKPSLPYFVFRTKVKERPVISWQGSGVQSASDAKLLDSPARQELRKRLLKGDSIVWLMVKSEDKEKNASIRKLLTNEFAKLEKEIKLPDGVGEPGSELYADVPLLLSFSLLEIDPADPAESYLVNLLTGFHPDAVEEGTPLVAPVFGRGRVLEVLPVDTVNDKLVKELTVFLCGACSCKVKGLNPGFDLLMTANWDEDLFGVDGERPNDNAAEDETPLPVLITIPPGRKKRD